MHPELGMIIYRERLREIELEHHHRRLACERAEVPPRPPARGGRLLRHWWRGAQRQVATDGGASTSGRSWSAAT